MSYLDKLMNLIEENPTGASRHYHGFHFASDNQVDFFYYASKDLNKPGSWQLGPKNSSDILYFNPETVLEALAKFSIPEEDFISHLEYILLTEAAYLNMILKSRYETFGSDRVEQAIKDQESFGKELGKILKGLEKDKRKKNLKLL